MGKRLKASQIIKVASKTWIAIEHFRETIERGARYKRGTQGIPMEHCPRLQPWHKGTCIKNLYPWCQKHEDCPPNVHCHHWKFGLKKCVPQSWVNMK